MKGMHSTTDSDPHSSAVKLFGLPAERGRWFMIPLGMVVLLCLGSVYSWSIFRKPLENELGISATESLLPYTVALVFYAALMPIAGFGIPRIGARLVCAIGGLIVGLGYVLASFSSQIGQITFAYGLIAGTGVGTAYGVPMAVVARWFPDRKGLAVGTTVVGFGLSPLITAPLANQLIGIYNVRPTLRILGIGLMVTVLAITSVLKMPPKGWLPPQASLNLHTSKVLTYPTNIFKSRSFYGLWLCYAIATLVGLGAIGISSPVGEELIKINPDLAAMSVALFALFNGISRPLFGWLSDRYKPHHIAISSYTLILVACILMVNAKPGQIGIYLIAFCLFWFCLGGWLAMAPALTLRFFDPDKYAQNYGIIFTAYGVGALLGNLAIGQLRDWFGSYTFVFYPMAILAISGIAIANSLLKRSSDNKTH